MSVRQRGTAWQVDVSYTLHGKAGRYRKDCETKVEAEAHEVEVRGKLNRGESPDVIGGNGDTGLTSMQSLMEAVVDRVWKHKKAARSHEQNAQLVIDTIGPTLHPASVTTRVIDACVGEWEKQGNSGSTINRKLSNLSVMLHYARVRGVVSVLPVLQRQKESKHRVRWYSLEEESRILNHFETYGLPMMSDYVAFLLDTGLRATEALGLRWSDTANNTITLHEGETKSDKGRVVPQTDRVSALLAKRGAMAKPMATVRVFWDIPTYRWAHRQWTKMTEVLKHDDDPQFILHTCRHTFCSRLVQAGVPILTVMQLAGHSSVAVTQRYAHLAPANLVNAMKVLNQVPNAPVQEQPRMRIAQ